MTSVLGHLTDQDFGPQYKAWKSCPPAQLFEAPIICDVAPVSPSPLLYLVMVAKVKHLGQERCGEEHTATSKMFKTLVHLDRL